MNLVQITIYFGEKYESQTMVVQKDTEAYRATLDYAYVNDYEFTEKPFFTDKEKNALEVALDWEIESLECETDGDYTEKLKAIKSVKEKLA
jgi:hypothetical protein